MDGLPSFNSTKLIDFGCSASRTLPTSTLLMDLNLLKVPRVVVQNRMNKVQIKY